MRYLLLLLAWLAGTPAMAQTAPATPQPNLLAASPQPAAPDPDTAAIHRLFAGRRHRHLLIAGITVGAAGGGATLAATGTDRSLRQGDYFKLYGLVAAIALGVEVLVSHSYTREDEQLALDALQTHQLPKWLKRKLNSTYFRQ